VIPSNITKEHIVSAINEIEKNGYPILREPTKYYIKYNEKTYPAKYALSISNRFANGQELMSSDFEGGTETNDFLKSRGFEIVVTEDQTNLNSMNKKIDLEKLILEYDKNKEFFGKRKITEKEAMQLRSEFISDFPQDKILELSIDKYVFGTINKESGKLDESTFCFRLEFRLPGFGGIRGTPATKFGIYFDREKQKYVYDEKKFSSPEESYKKIIAEINYLLQGGKQFSINKDWNKISEIFEKNYEIQSHVKSKILSVYYPDSFALIHSNERMKRILIDLFNVPEEESKNKLLMNQAKLLYIKQNHLIMKNWSNFDYSTFVWDAWNYYFRQDDSLPIEERLSEANQSKISFWVVRAGGKGKEEKDVLENNIITIHWNELSDISNFKEKDNLRSYYKKMLPNESDDQVAQGVGQVWSFLNEIKKDDIIILPLMSKYSKSIAICVIVGNYEFKEITPDIRHIRRVKWLHKEIPINEFNEITKKSLYSSRTVYRIQKQEAFKSIWKVMRKYRILDKLVKENSFEEKNVQQYQVLVTTIEKLSQIIYLSEQKLKNIQQLLNEKKQIIFYGPPGTSKTFVAKKFATYFTQNSDCIEIIQFHPSYSYEDFIEGIKPRLSAEGEATGFVKQPGIFKNLVDRCIKNPDKKFVLIIDEINRGNISKIFGELIYLLEYRNEKIHLTYSPTEEFYIPDNLYIIGTMNSADRSIAFVDYALRRRFYFIEFYPDEDILKKWFIKNGIKEFYQNNVLELMREINIEISKKLGREYQIGYSYFMNNLDYENVKRIIDYAIIPLIEQYFFGKKENVDVIRNICNTYLIRLQDLEEAKEKPFLKDSESFSS
jgi:5-methylcytosine-specific restriction protein B